MKILVSNINSIYQTSFNKNIKRKGIVNTQSTTNNTQLTNGVPSSYFSVVNFKGKPDTNVLFSHVKDLCCAYSGTKMLHPKEMMSIEKKLAKRPNAISTINLLKGYQDYMHTVESNLFDYICSIKNLGKKDFQEILQDLKPEAECRLKEKQINILNSANGIIQKLTPENKKNVENIRDTMIAKILAPETNGVFGRKMPLEELKKIKAKDGDLKRIIQIYHNWYSLPASSTDTDAFIVKYSKQNHQKIANRFLKTSVATIEHIIPTSRGGKADLGNYILVSAEFNNNRKSMPLRELIELRKDVDIEKNLQKYFDKIVVSMNRDNGSFKGYRWYPYEVVKTLQDEGKVSINLNKLNISRKAAYIEFCERKEKLKEHFSKM